MGLIILTSDKMLSQLLALFFISSSLALNIPSLEVVEVSPEEHVSSNQTTCPACLQIKSSNTVQNNYPWLFNNARFMYTRTDDRGWPVYQYYDNSQQRTLWLHFYDEGLFYDGYEESNGRVFVYNSDSDDCVEDTGRNWYYWRNNDWFFDESIHAAAC